MPLEVPLVITRVARGMSVIRVIIRPTASQTPHLPQLSFRQYIIKKYHEQNDDTLKETRDASVEQSYIVHQIGVHDVQCIRYSSYRLRYSRNVFSRLPNKNTKYLWYIMYSGQDPRNPPECLHSTTKPRYLYPK